ncbi:MAG: DNA-3-methyladenine glycosylase I [Candidatus Pacebacteria bacterium]|nr:DNA-3-methyladenine glycosylase I [Candidatus Paceibacterota bacterium]MCF7857474.1 DNA-3-methyladenine glycosylase I [Candidatus Paceibacterota bacterium]
MEDKNRCKWPQKSTELMISYHNNEWGVPVHDDNHLFEVLILDGAQAGLSWNTILNKRENYRAAFDNFDVKKVAKYTPNKIDKLLKNEGLVRNKLKIPSAVRNAKVFIEIQKEFGSFDLYLWKFVDGKPIQNKIKKMSDIPAHTELSDIISRDLKKRGMNFVGSTIIYAIMQTIGIVNDHEVNCFRYKQL